MRVLAAADLHGILYVYEWLLECARKHEADLVVLAGDLFAGDFEAGQRRQAREIIGLIQKTPAPLVYLMGNDDNVALGYEDERIRSLHGKRFRFGSYHFVGYEYTLPITGGPFEKPDNEIEKDTRSLEPLLDPSTVLVTHCPAYGSLDRVYGGSHVGSRALARLLERQPVLGHIHGHIHEDFGRDGNHFNVAAAGRKRAMFIELPGLHHTVLKED